MKKLFLLFFSLPLLSFSQTSFDKILKTGELLVTGVSIVKSFRGGDKQTEKKEEKTTVATVCIKNKMLQKITVKFAGLDSKENEIKKELVIQNDGKECVFEIPKGVYTYEILLENNEVYQKGEYKFEEEITITVKKE
jgi:hypothetical protein